MLPDPKHFGILWMEYEALANAYDMDGAFNDVTFSLQRDASVDEVIFRVDQLLDRYGGLGAFARKDQLSHLLLESDIQGLKTVGLLAPTIFLVGGGVSAQCRDDAAHQPAARTDRRAQGVWLLRICKSPGTILKFVLLIAMVGGAIGTLGGMWLAHDFTKMFLRVYQYPELIFRVRPNVVANAILVAGGAAIAGSFGAIALAVRLPPAEAMRPEPPARYRPTMLERIGLGRFVPNVARMILRQLERHPVKTSFSLIAIAMSVAIVVVGNFMRNSVDKVIQTNFYDVQRFDLSLAMVEPVSIDAIHELAVDAGRVRSRAAAHRSRPGCGRGTIRAASASWVCRATAGCGGWSTKTGQVTQAAVRRARALAQAGRGAARESGRDRCASKCCRTSGRRSTCRSSRCSTTSPGSTPTWTSRPSTG